MPANQRTESRTGRLRLAIGAALVLGICLVAAGCARRPTEAPAAESVSVPVSHPVQRYVTDHADFTARIAAVDSVDVKAHVWGYLDKVNFKEGALVKKGDVLFEIDARVYQATYDLNKAQVAQNEASLKLAQQNSTRAETLASQKPRGIAQAELDQYRAQLAQAVATLDKSRANLDMARLNLEWTKITAPVSGRVSRYNVTVGNLIQGGDQGGTLLTTIVSVDPMYAYFDVDEYTDQRVRKLIREGKFQFKSADKAVVTVSLGLATEEGFPHRGTINFADNQVNPKTGTLRVRGVFPNKDEALTPGYFARVRVPISPPHKALLVSERALDNDQGQKVVYVVDRENKVVSRSVRLGQMHDGLREVTEGLKPGERVIVKGLQQVRPGATVEPKLVDMPQKSLVLSP